MPESPPFLQSYINLYKNFFSFAVMPEGDSRNQKHRGKKPARCGSSDFEQNSSIGRTSLYIGTAERASGESKRNFKKRRKTEFLHLNTFKKNLRGRTQSSSPCRVVKAFIKNFSFAVMPKDDSHN